MGDELTYRELSFTRMFDAPREVVWRAWTDPHQLAAWWGPAGMSTPVESIIVDLRPGGEFRLTMVSDADGSEFPSEMVFHEVDPPSRLVYGWPAQRGLGAGIVTVTFIDRGARTEIVNSYAGDSTDEIAGFMAAGTNQQLDTLAAYLRSAPGPDVQPTRE